MTFFLTSSFVFLVFWRPQEWLFPAMFGWPVLKVMVGVTLLSMAVEINEGRLRVPRELPQLGLLIGLWVSAPLSHIAHTYFAGMIDSLMPVFTITFFTYLLIVVLDRPDRLRSMAWLFVIMGCSLAVHAILQKTRGYGFGNIPPMYIPAHDAEPEHYRSMFVGIFSDPNDLGQFLVTCMPLAFILTRRFNVLGLLLGSGITWLLFRAVMCTESRGAQMAMVAVAGTQILIWLPHRWFPYLINLGLGLALVLCPFSGSLLDASAHDRVVFWGLANRLFIHTPLFGIGYEMAWIVTTKNQALHNAFVTCYTELGLFGYWFWHLLILMGFLGAWRTRGALRKATDPRAKWLRRLAGQAMVAMMGFCVSAYFLSRTFIFPLFFLMAMLAAMPRLARPYLPPNYPPLFNKRRDMYIFGTISVLVSVVYVYISCILLNKAFYG